MMIVAMPIPNTSGGMALFMLMFSIEAIKAPVHTPVPGKGMPTKISNPQNS